MITGGQSFVSSPPAFSNDGKKLLVCTGATVSVFSTSTGLQVTELEGHTDRVTSVVVVPVTGPASKFMSFCWTSSLDGNVCYWDFAASELVKKVNVQLPIWSMVIPNMPNAIVQSNEKSSSLYAFLSVEDTSKSADQQKALVGQIQIFNLRNARRVGGLLAETRKPECITMSNSGEFLGIRNKRKLHIWRVPLKDYKYDEIRKIKLHHTKNLSALAFHPTERIVAGGDVTGRILIWRGFGRKMFSESLLPHGREKIRNDEERPGVRGNDDSDSCSTWHWHPSEVKFLFFSSDGAYLYSGGREGVLVVWQLDTGKKKFKPRLGSPLLYFSASSDPSLSCISCADNQIHLVKMPSVDIVKSISGIKPPFSVPDVCEGVNGGVVFDHSSGSVGLRTENYCIQFFSLLDNLEASQVQVCERNHQPVDDVTVVVQLIALSRDGSIMATVEVKLPEEGIGGLVNLKFWTQGSKTGEYSISTVIYEPHSEAGISALAFRPDNCMAVTSSFGGDFKIWVNSSGVQRKDQILQKSGWRCRSVGAYKKRPMTAAVFSSDGSVLAVAAETVVTLWDPDTNALVAVIGDSFTPIVALSFVGDLEYLISVSRGSRPQLAVWNLPKLSMHWSYMLSVEAVAASGGDGSKFAVLACPTREANAREQDGIILLFEVDDLVPMSTWSVKKARGGNLTFLSSNLFPQDPNVTERRNSPLLVYVNGDHEFEVFDPHGNQSQIGRLHRKNPTAAEEPMRFGYESIYGELPEFDLKKDQIPEIPFAPSDRPWETIFSGPSHVLPPLTKLCSTFLESILERNTTLKE